MKAARNVLAHTYLEFEESIALLSIMSNCTIHLIVKNTLLRLECGKRLERCALWRRKTKNGNGSDFLPQVSYIPAPLPFMISHGISPNFPLTFPKLSIGLESLYFNDYFRKMHGIQNLSIETIMEKNRIWKSALSVGTLYFICHCLSGTAPILYQVPQVHPAEYGCIQP